MSTHPYIPLYVDDFEAATAHLSPEEDGIYNRLLRLCWRTPGCSLPNEPAWIARKIRVAPEDFERVVRPLIDEFFTLSRGRLTQRRLKREYDDISRKKLARKTAGKKGGDAKAAKTQGKANSNASDLPAHTRAFPEPYPEPEPESQVVLFPEASERTSPQQRADGASRGSRLKADWQPSADNRAYAISLGFSDQDVDRVADDFRDYWVAQAGQKGVKLDWSATWRRWVRTQAERRAIKPSGGKRVGWV